MGFYPEGMTACSRWLSERQRATPPEQAPIQNGNDPERIADLRPLSGVGFFTRYCSYPNRIIQFIIGGGAYCNFRLLQRLVCCVFWFCHQTAHLD